MNKSIFITYYYEYDYDRSYPHYRVISVCQTFAQSLEEAEQKMLQQLEDKASWLLLHHVRTCEYDMNELNFIANPEHEYLYDAKGQRIDERRISMTYNEESELEAYWGRDEQDIRFHEGDIVEVFDEDKMYLGIVITPPPTKAEARSINGDSPFMDFSDDSYRVFTMADTENYARPDCLYLFQPQLPVPDAMAQQLRQALERHLKECNIDNIIGGPLEL